MTLEQLANIADIAGVLVIIASLFYLAQQVRQNTVMMRSAAATSFIDQDFNLSNSMIENRDVADVWVKAQRDFASLDDVDQARILVFGRKALLAWQHNFHLHENDLFPEYKWKEQEWSVTNFGRRQSVRQAWQAFRHAFDEPFQVYLDGLFARGDRIAD